MAASGFVYQIFDIFVEIFIHTFYHLEFIVRRLCCSFTVAVMILCYVHQFLWFYAVALISGRYTRFMRF